MSEEIKQACSICDGQKIYTVRTRIGSQEILCECAGGRKHDAPQTPEPSTLASATCSVAELRTVSDLLAAALVGEYPAEAALERYCATLARPYDVKVVMAKFRSKPQNVS